MFNSRLPHSEMMENTKVLQPLAGHGPHQYSKQAAAAARPKAYGAQSSVSGVLAPEVREAAAEVRQPSKRTET